MNKTAEPSEKATAASELSKVELFNLNRNLKKAFGEYGEVDSSIKQKMIDYLVSGANPECLLEIKAAMGKPERKFFTTAHGILNLVDHYQSKKLLEIYLQHPVPTGYYRRLGEIWMLHPECPQSKVTELRGLPDWFSTMLRFYNTIRSYHRDTHLRVASIAADLDEADFPAFIALLVESRRDDYSTFGQCLVDADDTAECLVRHPEALSQALLRAEARAVEEKLHLLMSRKVDCASILPTVIELMLKGGKKVKSAALQIIGQFQEPARPHLLNKLASGSNAERTAIAEALADVYGAGAIPDLTEAAAAEKNAKLRQSFEKINQQLKSIARSDDAKPAVAIDLPPPIELPNDPLPLPAEFRSAMEKMYERAYVRFMEAYEKQREHYAKAGQVPGWLRKPDHTKLATNAELDKLCDYLTGLTSKEPEHNVWIQSAIHTNSLETWCDPKSLHLLHIIRLMKATRLAYVNYAGLFLNHSLLNAHRMAQEKPYGLREVDAAVSRVYNESGLVMRSYLGLMHSSFDMEPEAVWPLFIEQPDVLRDAILGVSHGPQDYYVNERRRNALTAASTLPYQPKAIENALWALALGEGKSDRPAARAALRTTAGRLERGLQAIADGKQSIRIAGAELLADVGDPAAIEPLKKALKQEKQEAVKGSFLQAIETLGGDVEEFLGRRKQSMDAKKALEKKMPKGMEWFPLDQLPSVRWAEDDKPVAEEIVRWWVVQSIQFKVPACGPLLRRAMAMCRRDDAANLAKFVLSAWIGYDTQVPNASDLLAAATERARKEYTSHPWASSCYDTEEKYRDALLQQMQGQYINSAISEKGALAVVSAGGDKHCVRIAEKYIRTHHGQRLAQSKALLEVLGWIEDPLAVQVLLSIGNRFRTAGIRKRAAELVQELADRKGWTMDQLADRTIPDAGFVQTKGEDGQPLSKRPELVLDYGSRKFVVIMNDDLDAVIMREDGKEVKALPAAAKDDDPELVKAAKAEFTSAKKTVKDVVKILAEQLYEAVCNQRQWVASDWQTFLAGHPIAGTLCRRVVWRAHPQDEPDKVVFFRPLEDGSLTDVEDNAVTLNESDIVTVAHSSVMSAEQEQAWLDHLKDYEVPKLFVQFGRSTYRLSDADKDKTSIEDFKGHMLTNFKLRSRATKLGWQRGTAHDGGAFCDYFKPFRSAGIMATIEFSGSYLPEEDIAVALRSLSFTTMQSSQDHSDTWNPSTLKLNKVPAILISECYNDMREIASEGSGFDPEWEKKGLW